MSYLREYFDLYRYFSKKNARARQITFYAEGAMYYRYFRGYIQYILNHSDRDLCYISSEATDPIFKDKNSRIKKFYAKSTFPDLAQHIDARALIYTLDDLNQFLIKRSTNPKTEHIFTFHAVSSTTMVHRKGAFDFYDTIFCIGAYQQEEIRAREVKYSLPAKNLVAVGYPYLDD
ncbi:MAG: hypothetical protein LBF76_01715, partial [Holosporales bacterium]|nr:hypothetical protein [Holosporales bacterium]